MDEYYTWEDIYYLQYPHLLKDRTFSAQDIIRFYHHNLSMVEAEEVREYFCEVVCAENLPPPDELPKAPELPLLPPPPLPLLPLLPFVPPVPSLPPPIPPALEPPQWFIPIFPFIIPQLLPPDILNYILDMVGEREAHAAETPYMQPFQELYAESRVLIMQNISLQTKLDGAMQKEIASSSYIGWLEEEIRIMAIELEYKHFDDEEPYKYEPHFPDDEESEYMSDEIDTEGGVYDRVTAETKRELEIADDVLATSAQVAEEYGIEFVYRGWMKIGTTVWYYITIDNKNYELTFDDLVEMEHDFIKLLESVS